MTKRKDKTEFTDALGMLTFHAIASGKTLGDLPNVEGLPGMDVIQSWLESEPGFFRMLNLGKYAYAQKLAQEAMDIADNADTTTLQDVEKARLRAEVRMWKAKSLWPSEYTEKM
ncbi:hypothetical protein [Enterobacter kobei]|uniref:terminase small subunit-like protein n=1 Tax=Enterobacter kobei TaxID=208224 RepID=UPI000682561C|nr:hypothetical protein [Enterobacter kobei]